MEVAKQNSISGTALLRTPGGGTSIMLRACADLRSVRLQIKAAAVFHLRAQASVFNPQLKLKGCHFTLCFLSHEAGSSRY